MGIAVFTEEIVGLAEIAEMANVQSKHVYNWYNRHPDFPVPIKVLKCGPLFQREPVVAWLKKRTFITDTGARRAFNRQRIRK